MIDATTIARKFGLDFKVGITSAVVASINETHHVDDDGLTGLLELIVHTYHIAACQRRKPQGDVFYFSVNITKKGTANFLKLKAGHEDIGGENTVALDLFDKIL